jgi:hypothetical protein
MRAGVDWVVNGLSRAGSAVTGAYVAASGAW